MSKAILNTLQSLEQPDKVVDVRDIAMYHETIAKQKTQIYQLLKKSCAEAGLTLVTGSFEEGASVTLKTQVVWQQATGKIFGWFQDGVKTISAGSTPTSSGGIGAGAWVDRTDLMLRSDINIVQKRFSCVADVVADTSLTIGKIVETIGYYDGWAGALSKPSGGNRYEIVAAGTGTADGGAFIELSNGLQAKGLFCDGKVNAEQFGAQEDTDASSNFQNAIDYLFSSGDGFGGEINFSGSYVVESLNPYKNQNYDMNGNEYADVYYANRGANIPEIVLKGNGKEASKLKVFNQGGSIFYPHNTSPVAHFKI